MTDAQNNPEPSDNKQSDGWGNLIIVGMIVGTVILAWVGWHLGWFPWPPRPLFYHGW